MSPVAARPVGGSPYFAPPGSFRPTRRSGSRAEVGNLLYRNCGDLKLEREAWGELSFLFFYRLFSFLFFLCSYPVLLSLLEKR